MKQSGIIVAGTHSGCGKTSLTVGIIAALRARGLGVQPFKCGPDYIDPGFHAVAAGVPGRNLDTRMMGKAAVRELYGRQRADISVLEGVMGLFDGMGAMDEYGSTAHLAKVLGLPVVLVVDGRGLARSAAALVKGFVEFDPGVQVVGVVLNRVGSDRHARLLKEVVEKGAGVEVLGCVRRGGGWELPSRHLGLVPAWEEDRVQETIKAIANQVEDEVNLDRLMELAGSARELVPEAPRLFADSARGHLKKKTVIAVARDEAFCFYYQDNLDLLEAHGALIRDFSPLKHERLPEGTAALWLGGGYPELHARALADNGAMLAVLRAAAARNMPIFAECGGYMYLAEAIVDAEGERYPMAGILPGTAVMGERLAALGYCTVRLRKAAFFGPAGTELGGHVFHWCRMEGAGDSAAFESDGALLGAAWNQVLGSWFHIHFASNPLAAARFVEAGEKYAHTCV